MGAVSTFLMNNQMRSLEGMTYFCTFAMNRHCCIRTARPPVSLWKRALPSRQLSPSSQYDSRIAHCALKLAEASAEQKGAAPGPSEHQSHPSSSNVSSVVSVVLLERTIAPWRCPSPCLALSMSPPSCLAVSLHERSFPEVACQEHV